MKQDAKHFSKRQLGSTGLKVSTLGLGGFHQCEVDAETVAQVFEHFVELGGNFVETARSYGDGASETKLGMALKKHRKKLILASKTVKRDAEGGLAGAKQNSGGASNRPPRPLFISQYQHD
jgi:aryl-alcohol dehydrogenase-like predicted oxidoreductase